MRKTNKYIHLTLALILGCSLSACGAGERLANVGKAPEMAKISNPHLAPDYQPVSMPMPPPKVAARQPNSLWDANRTAFFKDQRAADVGDILTVLIEISDEAQLENSSERSRSSTESAGLESLLGYEAALDAILPEAVDNNSLIGANADSAFAGEGEIEREEEITVELAAIITQVLPNGNFVIDGTQEVRVNFEKRILQVNGIIRPADISINNTINHNQIAEARIVYGGQGQVTDVQQPRYGQQVYDVLFPF